MKTNTPLLLDITPREAGKHIGKIRKEGNIPAVYYGPGVATTPVVVNAMQFGKVFEKAGESTVVSLKGEKNNLDALIHDVSHDPITGVPTHIDFYLVAKDRKIQVNIPVVFTGVAPAERTGGAVVKVMHEIRVEALPAQLPHEFVVDLSSLVDLDSNIAIKDLKLPEGVRAVQHAEDIVVAITRQKEEVEEAPVAVDMAAIEVEKKGKKDEEGAEGEAEEKK